MDGDLFVVRLECGADDADALEAGLGWCEEAVRQENAVTGRICFEVFLPDEAAAERQREVIERAWSGWEGRDRCRLAVERLAARDWRESWKAGFHATRISERIVIKPSWESWQAAPGDCVVELDPGMSFGTGLHFTTRSCLRFIDAACRERAVRRVCDLGCGSGILASAAAMLGVPEVVAVDNDPVAVACTRENAARNGVLDRVHSRVGDVSDPAIGAGFDLVLANILAGVLIEQAPAIAGRVAPGAPLVLAGLTLQDVDTVLAAYNRLGFRETERASDEVWSTLQLRRG